MASQTDSENKSVGIAKVIMTIVTILLIVLLFVVPLWKSNLDKTSGVSKLFGGIAFAAALVFIATEKYVRNRWSETLFYIGWFVSIIIALLLMMNGGL